MTGPREEHACRGGGAMGTAESRELVFRWKASWARAAPTADDPATGPSPSSAQEPALPWPPPSGSSGPTAPCRGNSTPPSSTSMVGDAGGEMRGFRLVEAPESNFSNPFFSFWKNKKQNIRERLYCTILYCTVKSSTTLVLTHWVLRFSLFDLLK